MPRSIDQVLARAILVHRPHTYTDQEIEAAESRIAARVADRLPPAVSGPPRSGGREADAFHYLATLCRTVVGQDGALQHMAALLGGRVPEPEGARVLGCVLQLAGCEDSARFWWQFAAGAGDGAAAYCLYLHHLILGETWEAALWHRQADPDRDPETADEEREDGSCPALVLRVLARLCGDRACLTAAAAAVVHYVPDAVQFVDEIELPLPAADFAQRIEELTATA
ncbi:hypothetical protein [Streptomyces sp. MP131-18]|uniref:hypothetical protein n=1 Tax=Streptomyces sp. MP131-18 TaxID=1857892 RepID=UPI00097C9835|nr:hypothetical protein [Streptomyces sp. MP131-18]ONK12706.1 hypothetical protein STBA_34570 [Streptomyces sp. MP131-18]